jgi:hypothetical protein
MESPALESLYDDRTLELLDRGQRRRPSPVPSRWRQRTAAGAVVTALAIGVREVLEPERRDEIVEEIDTDGLLDPTLPVRYIHVAGAPKASVAIARPWLL